MRETKRLQAVALETESDGQRRFSGRGAVFNNTHPTSQRWSLGPDWKDRIAPGAFRTSLARFAQTATMPTMLYNHDLDNVIGAYESISENRDELEVKGILAADAQTPAGADLFGLMKMKALTGLSIGFDTVRQSLDQKSRIRTIEEIDLYEVSVVSVPANPEARIESVKSLLENPKVFERQLRDALGLSREQAKRLLAGGWSALLRDAGEAEEEQDPARDARADSLRDAASRDDVFASFNGLAKWMTT